jgi:hypothetical protein
VTVVALETVDTLNASGFLIRRHVVRKKNSESIMNVSITGFQRVLKLVSAWRALSRVPVKPLRVVVIPYA